MKTLIIGIGNLLRSDDGVGLHIIEALRNERLGDTIDLMEVLTGLDILNAIKGYNRIIIVDAVQTGDDPGTVHQLSPDDFKDQQTVHSFSTHLNMDFPSMLELGKKLFPGKIPEHIIVIAVEAEDIITISDQCTPKVQQAIPKVVSLMKGLLN